MTRLKRTMRVAGPIGMTVIGLTLAACQPAGQPLANEAAEAPAANATDTAANAMAIDNGAAAEDRAETKSIIRPDIEPAPTPTPTPEPIDLTIPFPAKGAKPDAAGAALLDTLLANPTYALGGPITIWGHSDSSGSDQSNLTASRKRAESARDYLVQKGTAPERITVIAMGEATPIAPNRKRDGTDDPEGRDKNRRVEIKVDLPPSAAPAPAPVPAEATPTP
ncbi:OmpA family protein [Sphingomonas sp.]|uniref:OmpA family protein n=1 Tax=Sphingomonas sp. TaxID=28214 RepID=UPI00289921FC|nr:OmpA family protein [Sphingomonas sp.]